MELRTFIISLHQPSGPFPMAAVRAHSLNALFHTELGKHHPTLVEDFHRFKGPAPFSLAPQFNHEHFLGFRVGTLTAEVGQRVAEVWGGLAANREEVTLGSARLRVEGVKPDWPKATTYQQLWAEAPLAHGVRLSFETPVIREIESALNRKNVDGTSNNKHKGILFPEPATIWEQYFNVWTTYSNFKLKHEENFLAWVKQCVLVTNVVFATRYAKGERQVEWKGGMGEVEYHVFSDASLKDMSLLPDYLRAWQALALLAEFCGTGEKATMGMGRTRRIKTFGEHRDKAEA